MRITLMTLVAVLFCGAAFAADNAGQPPEKTAPPESADMVRIFNGKDLSGWNGDPRLWSVKNGVIHGETTADKPARGNTFILWQGGKPGDFDLRLSFKIESGNAGVQYRSRHLENHRDNKWVVAGYQAEVANSPATAGFLYDEKGRASLAQVGEKVVIDQAGKKSVVGSLGSRQAIGATYRMSDWNDYVIICKGNHIQHFLNGVQTIDLVDDDAKNSARSGVIALQIHAGPPMVVEFKDLRIKIYDRDGKASAQ